MEKALYEKESVSIKNPILSKKQEDKILEKFEKSTATNGRNNLEKLILSNFRLVLSVANKKAFKIYPQQNQYNLRNQLKEDLIQEGLLGLIKATEKADPSKENKFSTYATWWINQNIKRYLSNHLRVVRIPENKIYKKRKNGEKFRKEISMDTSNSHQYNNYPLSSRLESKKKLVVDDFFSKERKEYINSALSTLPNREQLILRLRFGYYDSFDEKLLNNISKEKKEYILKDKDSMTLEKVGEILNLHRERVRQLESSALTKLSYKGSFPSMSII